MFARYASAVTSGTLVTLALLYTMQGLIDLVQKDFFPTGSNILYAHLGGAPALNGYAYTYRNG